MPGFNKKFLCGVPLAQRIARWTSNPKVLGSIPRWDEKSFDFLMLATNDQQTFWIYPSHSFLSVVVITCASHAQGRRFEPGRKQNYFFVDKYLPQDSPHLFCQIWYLGTKNKIDTVHTVTQTCMIFAYFEYLGYKSRFYGVMVSTLDFESSDPSSNLGRTFSFCL